MIRFTVRIMKSTNGDVRGEFFFVDATYRFDFCLSDKHFHICAMSRLPDIELFGLITALTKNEKRYVKQELRRHRLAEVNQTEVLFDAIAEQDVYDEGKLKDRLAAHGCVKRLPKAKRELLDIVLRAMRQYHAQHGIIRRAVTALQDAEFLRQRGQFRTAEQILTKTIAFVRAAEMDALEAVLLSSYRDTLRVQGKLPVTSSNAADDEQAIVARKLVQSVHMEHLADRMEHLTAQYGRSPTQAAKAVAADIVRAGESVFPIISAAAKNHWLRLLSRKALFIDNQPEVALQHDLTRLEVLDSNDGFKQSNRHLWANLQSSIALRLLLLGRHVDARTYRNNLYNHWNEYRQHLSPQSRQTLGAQVVNIEVLLALQSFDFEALVSELHLTDEILDSITAPKLAETVMVCHFNIALVMFGLGRYRACIDRLHVVAEFPPELRTELHTAGRILTILCHVEQENESVVTSLVRSERRRYKETSVPADVEVMLALALKICQLPPGSRLTNTYKKALSTLESLSATDSEPVTAIFNAKAWITARLNKKSWRDFANIPS